MTGSNIREFVARQRLFNDHEHISPITVRQSLPFTFFDWFVQYSGTDLIIAGLTLEDLDRVLSPSELGYADRWRLIEPFWEVCRTTQYGKVLSTASRELFAIENISSSTWESLNELVVASNSDDDLYRRWLKDRAGISYSVVDPQRPVNVSQRSYDHTLFGIVRRWDGFLTVKNRSDLEALGMEYDIDIVGLDGLLDVIDASFERARADGVIGMKVAVAYDRTLLFDPVHRRAAKASVDAMVSERVANDHPASAEVQSYIFHEVVDRASELGWTVQIHTGLQEGIGHDLSHSDPMHLVSTFQSHPGTRFEVFHAGYPWTSEVAALAKQFPNVYLSMCWVWAISSALGRRVLDEWLELLPSTKIIAFGGDYFFPEGTVGEAMIARDGIAEVLENKIGSGYMSELEAMEIAERIMLTNGLTLFPAAANLGPVS